MSKSRLLGAICVGSFSFMAMPSSVYAATADNVKCEQCVSSKDIKKSAISKSKIKNGAVTKGKLSDDVLELINTDKRYVIVDNNDQTIGAAIGGDVGEPVIMTSQGYHTEVDAMDGTVNVVIQVFYTGVDCTGIAYADLVNSLEDTTTDGGIYIDGGESAIGAVYNVDDPGIEYWYVPKTPTLVDNTSVQSVLLYDDNSGAVVCDTLSDTITTAAEIFPNDPAITGFPNAAFAAPLKYDYR